MPATAVREKPILFNGEMVRAILDGRKTQTRRVVKPQPDESCWFSADAVLCHSKGLSVHKFDGRQLVLTACPYGQPGDRLWVRETWTVLGNEDGHPIDEQGKLCQFRDAAMRYRADVKPAPYGLEELPDGGHYDGTWRPSIHMPRWASRLTLEITDVRVERLQSITEADAIAEGAYALSEDGMSGYGDDATLHRFPHYTYRWGFKDIWDSINAKSHPWDANPWTWVVSFKRVEP